MLSQMEKFLVFLLFKYQISIISRTCTWAHTNIYTLMNTHAHIQIHVNTHRNTHSHTRRHIDEHTGTHTHKHIHKYTRFLYPFIMKQTFRLFIFLGNYKKQSQWAKQWKCIFETLMSCPLDTCTEVGLLDLTIVHFEFFEALLYCFPRWL